MYKRYKFSDKSQSTRGILSTLLAVAAVCVFGIAVWISFQNRGAGGIEIGVLGICSVFLSAYGLYIGIKSFQEEEIFLLFSWIGSIANSVMLLVMFMVILLGW